MGWYEERQLSDLKQLITEIKTNKFRLECLSSRVSGDEFGDIDNAIALMAQALDHLDDAKESLEAETGVSNED